MLGRDFSRLLCAIGTGHWSHGFDWEGGALRWPNQTQ